MTGTSGSYNTDAMRAGATHLDAATSSLSALTQQLARLAPGAVPPVVDHALDRLARRGHDVIRDIADESSALAGGLRMAAQCYEDLEQSLIRRFGAP
jgi:hypothetical protein